MPDLENRIIIGGGFAGIMAAYWAAADTTAPPVILLEKELILAKWLDSFPTGPFLLGRTDSETTRGPEHYPRGGPEVERILEKWPGSSTRDWLVSLGLAVSENETGAIFAAPASELKECLMAGLTRRGVEVRTGFAVEAISVQPDGGFRLWSKDGKSVEAGSLLMATGGERNHGLKLARELGAETTIPLAAYLRLRLANPKVGEQFGPLTCPVRLRFAKTGAHATGLATLSARGLEGPAVSSLSAQLCQTWSQMGYRIQLEVDWLPGTSAASVRNVLSTRCERGGRRNVGDEPLFGFTSRQWNGFLRSARIEAELPWPRLKPKQIQALTQRLKSGSLAFAGMGLPAGERAWAGGISPSSLDCNTCQADSVPGLYFAGEILDLLGMPGGSHLNIGWASGYLAGISMGLAGTPA